MGLKLDLSIIHWKPNRMVSPSSIFRFGNHSIQVFFYDPDSYFFQQKSFKVSMTKPLVKRIIWCQSEIVIYSLGGVDIR